jgi:xanthine dehydrogenase large subunit
MLGIEQVMDEIARALGRDPLEVRRVNLYGTSERNVTPFGQIIEDNVAPALIDELARNSGYAARRKAVERFNRSNPIVKRGLALTPVRFGISFTATHFNQAGALVHVYQDGSVQLNHGGTEMGQGLYVKVAQVVASEFGLGLDRIRVTATNTGKVPNTSATAASSGSDLNGMAAQAAARTVKERMAGVAAGIWGVAPSSVAFAEDRVVAGDNAMSFAELAKKTYMARVSLSATGYYRTPKIAYDRATFSGRPFYYFAYGAAASEVEIDTLSGEYRVLRADLLHDVGSSLNPAIDIGQIEGGFVQGMGWLTTEELVWDDKGRLATHAPSTYKIPACSDLPADFRVALWPTNPNVEDTIHRSKAVGEPPFMLGISVFLALRDAVAACGRPGCRPPLDAPATPERVLFAIEAVR